MPSRLQPRPRHHLHRRYDGGAALVTGASSGIGREYAKALAREGLDLVIVARRADRLERLAEGLRARWGVRVLAVAEDLAAPGAADRIVATVKRRHFDVCLLVNNAGFGTFGDLAEQDIAVQRAMVDVNCGAVVELTRLLLPALRERGQGGIIVVSSILGHFPLPGMSTYAATKVFDLFFALSLWGELRGMGLDVQALCPGPTASEFSAVAGSPDRGPLGRKSAREVVERSLARLGRSPVVTPGWRNTLLVGLLRITPAWLAVPVLRAVAGRRK